MENQHPSQAEGQNALIESLTSRLRTYRKIVEQGVMRVVSPIRASIPYKELVKLRTERGLLLHSSEEYPGAKEEKGFLAIEIKKIPIVIPSIRLAQRILHQNLKINLKPVEDEKIAVRISEDGRITGPLPIDELLLPLTSATSSGEVWHLASGPWNISGEVHLPKEDPGSLKNLYDYLSKWDITRTQVGISEAELSFRWTPKKKKGSLSTTMSPIKYYFKNGVVRDIRSYTIKDARGNYVQPKTSEEWRKCFEEQLSFADA